MPINEFYFPKLEVKLAAEKPIGVSDARGIRNSRRSTRRKFRCFLSVKRVLFHFVFVESVSVQSKQLDFAFI